ncbi:putative Casein kinase I [Blattamonas nauphoetae]|uniref:non-specific serine/threonine protein kinase n=1 Tax=Blattamonas nauphoetae TaxID=2049346 RepID=A0ABQ9XKF4_9EUKA|nr:putative Casein kinase I [Blattamonas nauphoetae]
MQRNAKDEIEKNIAALGDWLIADTYLVKTKKKIGAGSFGYVYRAVVLGTGEEVAVKTESSTCKSPCLYYETRLYRVLQGGVGIPNVRWYGVDSGYNIMVMDLLGSSLDDLFVKCNRRFSLKTVLLIAEQVISRIEYIHSKFFIHRDLKPGNLTIGRGKKSGIVHLIDLGLSKRYRDAKTHQHIPYKEAKGITGTVRYSSMNSHIGIEGSRRDDLESIGYIFVEFLTGTLPWSRVKEGSKRKKFLRIGDLKMSISIEELCKGLPQEFATYITYCRNLRFDEKPDYSYLRRLFRELMRREGYENDQRFDWVRDDDPEEQIQECLENRLQLPPDNERAQNRDQMNRHPGRRNDEEDGAIEKQLPRRDKRESDRHRSHRRSSHQSHTNQHPPALLRHPTQPSNADTSRQRHDQRQRARENAAMQTYRRGMAADLKDKEREQDREQEPNEGRDNTRKRERDGERDQRRDRHREREMEQERLRQLRRREEYRKYQLQNLEVQLPAQAKKGTTFIAHDETKEDGASTEGTANQLREMGKNEMNVRETVERVEQNQNRFQQDRTPPRDTPSDSAAHVPVHRPVVTNNRLANIKKQSMNIRIHDALHATLSASGRQNSQSDQAHQPPLGVTSITREAEKRRQNNLALQSAVGEPMFSSQTNKKSADITNQQGLSPKQATVQTNSPQERQSMLHNYGIPQMNPDLLDEMNKLNVMQMAQEDLIKADKERVLMVDEQTKRKTVVQTQLTRNDIPLPQLSRHSSSSTTEHTSQPIPAPPISPHQQLLSNLQLAKQAAQEVPDGPLKPARFLPFPSRSPFVPLSSALDGLIVKKNWRHGGLGTFRMFDDMLGTRERGRRESMSGINPLISDPLQRRPSIVQPIPTFNEIHSHHTTRDTIGSQSRPIDQNRKDLIDLPENEPNQSQANAESKLDEGEEESKEIAAEMGEFLNELKNLQPTIPLSASGSLLLPTLPPSASPKVASHITANQQRSSLNLHTPADVNKHTSLPELGAAPRPSPSPPLHDAGAQNNHDLDSDSGSSSQSLISFIHKHTSYRGPPSSSPPPYPYLNIYAPLVASGSIVKKTEGPQPRWAGEVVTINQSLTINPSYAFNLP